MWLCPSSSELRSTGFRPFKARISGKYQMKHVKERSKCSDRRRKAGTERCSEQGDKTKRTKRPKAIRAINLGKWSIKPVPDPLVPLKNSSLSGLGIENSLHYGLDVTFREDECRIRKGEAPENFVVLRHIARNYFKIY